MEPADLDEVLRIEQASFPTPWSRELLEKELAEPRSRFFVALIAGRVAGYAGYWLIADEAHIVTLAVDPPLRRRGIGREMLRRILEESRAAGLVRATLEVRMDSDPAIRLYEKAGFRSVAVRPNYYQRESRDACVMCMDL